jgi:hypothetical protein
MGETFRRMEIMAGGRAWEEAWPNLSADERAEIDAAIQEGRRVADPGLVAVALGRIHNARARWYRIWGPIGAGISLVLVIGLSIWIESYWPFLALPSVPFLIVLLHSKMRPSSVRSEKANMQAIKRV